jgi:Mg-chelatase subunit ChlD
MTRITHRLNRPNRSIARTGAILPLFAFLLPVILIICGFAINMAYMQMVSTDIKIMTDAAAHAGGRAMSIQQTTDAAIAKATQIAQANTVGGRVLSVGNGSGDEVQVGFGLSQRSNNGYGMYQFTSIPKAQVDSRAQRANSVSVVSNAHMPLVFQSMNFSAFGGNMTHFDLARRSIATQVDRDIALVLDRSGSMLWYMDETALTNMINTLYNTYDQIDNGYWHYHGWSRRSNGTWRDRGYNTESYIDSQGWTIRDRNDRIWQPDVQNVRRISQTERDDALDYLYDRTYTDNVVYQIERYLNPSHTLGTSYTQSEQSQLTQPMSQYVSDWRHSYQTNQSSAPRFSRWYFLVQGVDAFLDVLDSTDQIEHVSLVTFASSARVDLQIQTTYNSIRNGISSIVPNNATATGDGMNASVPTITTAPAARLFASKTIVVLTDGAANYGTTPVNAATQIRASNNITIHTVTFTPQAEIAQMQQAAEIGGGKHYHTNEGAELDDIFEEIANNLPTILTE